MLRRLDELEEATLWPVGRDDIAADLPSASLNTDSAATSRIAPDLGVRVKQAVILGCTPGSVFWPADQPPHYLWPMLGRPQLAYLMRRLKHWGIQAATLVCTNQLSDEELDLLNEAARQIDFTFELVHEPEAKGPAGAIRLAALPDETEPLLVVRSSCLLPDIDLNALTERHTETGAAMSLVVEPVHQLDQPLLHVTDGWIDRVSQPDEAQLGDSWQDAGICLLSRDVIDRIPANEHLSLTDQWLPSLLEQGNPILAHCTKQTPSRIDHPESYRCETLHLLEKMHQQAEVSADRWIARDAVIGRNVTLQGSVYIGPRAVIEDDAELLGPCVIEEGVTVGQAARIRQSVIQPNCHIGAGSIIHDSVILSQSIIHPPAVIQKSLHANAGGVTTLTRLDQCAGAKAEKLTTPIGKRIFDVVVSVLLLIVLSPVMLIAALAILLDSKGPIFFRQKRCGRGGQEFFMIKLRTMVADAEARQQALRAANEVDGPMFKIERDPRITRVGWVLRKTCIDELPQLINVLRGEMSLVGPRPLARHEMRYAAGWRDTRLRVVPGVTGLWQVRGRRHFAFADWIRYDLAYVRQYSLLLDIQIIFETIWLVLKSFLPQFRPASAKAHGDPTSC